VRTLVDSTATDPPSTPESRWLGLPLVTRGGPLVRKGQPMEIVIIIFLVVCVIWLAMKVWNRAKESDEAALANAWRVVLSDPNYKKRRPLEERKHTVEERAVTLGEAARETSES
jgi:hypothetical protein